MSAKTKARRRSIDLSSKLNDPAADIPKVALLGCGSSGKSTLFKHISEATGSSSDFVTYRSILYSNILMSLRFCCEKAKSVNLILPPDLQSVAGQILEGSSEDWTRDLAKMVKVLPLCQHPEIQNFARNKFHVDARVIDAGFPFFPALEYLENAQKWLAPNYNPMFEDVLKVRVRTTGLVEVLYTRNRQSLKFFDTGGERSERKKWIHLKSDNVVYVMNLVNYLGVLFEDDTQNRSTEDFLLFESLWQNNRLYNDVSAVFVVWTHIDEFQTVFPETVNKFKEIHPDFTGTTHQEALEFMNAKLRTLAGAKLIDILVVNGLSIEDGKRCVEELSDKLFQVIGSAPAKIVLEQGSMRGKNLSDASPMDQYVDAYDELDLSKNKFTTCLNLVQLKTLKVLDLSSNTIRDMSALLGLPLLNNLNLSDNAIASLPLDCSAWKDLLHLDLNKNAIVDITSIATITALKHLYLNNNSMTELPTSLVKCKSLETLEVAKNPLVTPPKAVIKSGLQAIIKFLEQLTQSKVRWNLIKCVIVGKEGVGKTYLTKRLKGEEYKHNISTDGIDISLLPPMKSKELNGDIKFNVFDFGGQEVFYPTHMFYLQSKGVYVIVFNLADPQPPRLEYWLRTIRWLGGLTARIVLVGTHLDAAKDAAIQSAQKMVDKFKRSFNVSETIFISNKTKKGLSEFKELIVTGASKLSLLKTEVPYSYEVAAQRCRNAKEKGTPFLVWKDFRALLTDVSSDDAVLTALAGFLHEAGVVIWFNQPPINELIILSPEWLANVMSSIVSFKARWSKGVVPHAMLPQIWKHIPADQHEKVMAILERFEILFPLKGVLPLQSIAPCMLPPDQPKEYQQFVASRFDAKLKTNINKFVRAYKFEFMPIGFFPRLIVRAMHSKGISYKMAWMNGVILEEAEKPGDSVADLAQLAYDPDKFILTITLLRATDRRSSTSIDLFSALIHAVNSIVDHFYTASKDRLESTALCHKCMESGVANAHKFTEEELIQAFTSGKPLVQCLQKHSCAVADIAPDISFSRLPIVKDVIVEKLLAQGGFGKVFKGLLGTHEVAIKELLINSNAESQLNRETFRSFYHEIYMMTQCDHPNLVKLFGVQVDPLRMIMEYAGEKDLMGMLKYHHQEMPWKVRYTIALHVSKAMSYLHQLQPPIIHRDLRSPNVFISTGAGDQVTAKVGDFGLAAHGSSKMNEMLATWTWLAPEVFDAASSGYDERSDIYSFAMILWNMACPTDVPFAGCAQFLKTEETKITQDLRVSNPKIVDDLLSQGWEVTDDGRATRQTFKELEIKRAIINDGLRPSLPADCPVFISGMINKCWQGNPKLRPSFAHIAKEFEQEMQSLGYL